MTCILRFVSAMEQALSIMCVAAQREPKQVRLSRDPHISGFFLSPLHTANKYKLFLVIQESNRGCYCQIINSRSNPIVVAKVPEQFPTLVARLEVTGFLRVLIQKYPNSFRLLLSEKTGPLRTLSRKYPKSFLFLF